MTPFRHTPIETIAEAQRRAKRRLPKPVYTSVIAGNDKGLTTAYNVETFDELGFIPRVGVELPAVRDMATTLLGQEISLPVVLSPAGVQAITPGGEVPAARASAKVGTAIGQSNFASMAFEDVAKANPKAFFQIYWTGSREEIAARVERMRTAGAKALIATLDAMPSQARDWGSPSIPERVNLASMIRYAPMGLSRPAWLLGFVRNGGLPDLKVPNLSMPGKPTPTLIEGFMDWVATPLPTWKDIAWLKEIWGGPFMVKGVMTVEDAKTAVEIGADAISVSNHGGNNLDSTPSALRALPGIVEAVGDQVEIAYDGGIRRGGDVIKALALGARVVLVGRAYLFGLAADANGQRGVEEILEVLRAGIDKTLVGLGRASVHDVSRADLVIPDGFAINS
jgi:heme/flavin dehydrogenase (mycofactocin system)